MSVSSLLDSFSQEQLALLRKVQERLEGEAKFDAGAPVVNDLPAFGRVRVGEDEHKSG